RPRVCRPTPPAHPRRGGATHRGDLVLQTPGPGRRGREGENRLRDVCEVCALQRRYRSESMSKTAVRTAITEPPVAAGVPSAGRRAEKGPVRGVLAALASLRLTVVLFSLSLVLVFCGTLAQVDAGIW